MNSRFILDENIIILAQRGRDEYGNTNPGCADLVQQIIEICHTVVVDDVLWAKYIVQLTHPGYNHPNLGQFLIRSLHNALMVTKKVDGLGHTAPTMGDEGLIPPGSQDDTYLVRLAVETGATLVTTDGALRDDLASCGILSKYGITVVSPEDALRLL